MTCVPGSTERQAQNALAWRRASLACLGTGAGRAEGDAAKGKAAFERQCAICHTVDKAATTATARTCSALSAGRPAPMPDFTYTNAFKTRANWEWTEDAIGGWVMFPRP